MMSGRKRDFHRRKKTEEKTMDSSQDMLSKLPEPLIIHILSMLELKDAIKTGVLAKSWKNIWTQVHNIVLDCDARWISSVDSALTQCTTTYVDRFCLIGHWFMPDYIIDKWISYALDRNVKIMELTLYNAAPECLFQSSSITKMELFHIKFSPSTLVNLSSLKSLLLDNPNLDGATLERLLMGCPVLENLILVNVCCLHHLNVMSPSVKKLKLRWFDYVNHEIYLLNIKAPWIQELEISEIFFTPHCHLVDVSFLVKTTLTFHPSFPPVDIFSNIFEKDMLSFCIEKEYNWLIMVTKLLNSLSYVGELIIGSEPIQALLLSKLSGTPSPLFMCKHLSVETHIWKFDLPGIACLLENAPHLETLLIKVVPFSCDPKDAFPLSQTQTLFHEEDPHLNMPKGKFSQLKNVKIEYCQRSCHDNIKDNHGGFFDFELVEYILKSAVVLEKLVLCSSRGWSCSDSTCLQPNCSFQYVPSLFSKLISTLFTATGKEADGWEFKKSKNKLEFTFSNYASLLSLSDSPSSSTN